MLLLAVCKVKARDPNIAHDNPLGLRRAGFEPSWERQPQAHNLLALGAAQNHDAYSMLLSGNATRAFETQHV